jgi:excisionase family DNA binding protein
MDAVKYYTVATTAEIFACSPKTIRRMIHEGRLRAVQLGGDYRISAEALAEFIEEGEKRARGITTEPSNASAQKTIESSDDDTARAKE